MKLKKLFNLFLVAIIVISFTTFGHDNIYADTATPTSTPQLDLTVTPNNEKNYNDLNWSISDPTQSYSYRLFSKKSTDSDFQSIPCKGDINNKIKVLNIYPENTAMSNYKDNKGNTIPASAQAKAWMENNNYGKDIINVDTVFIDDFNSNPDNYLKEDSNGNWNYDVVYIGAWDSNNAKDLSSLGITSIENFIKSGRGLLAGHDTITMWFNPTNLLKLAPYANIETFPFTNNNYIASNATMPWVGSDKIKVIKKGLLDNYPWPIYDLGSTMTIPYCHTNSQVALGDIWFSFSDIKSTDTVPGTGPIRGDYNGNGTNNFYLTTWNNVAMIQTGHSYGQATPDEQKILANTLFYLAQVTNNLNWQDHKGQDVDAPKKPVINSVTNDTSKNQISLNYSSTDNGSTYDYYVETINKNDGTKIDSPTKTSTITTGLQGYSIVVDQNPDTIPSTTVTTTSTNYVVNNSYKNDFYVHIAAIDNAGNISEVTHQKVQVQNATGITLNKNTDELITGQADKLIATVTPDDAVDKSVAWSTSDSSIVSVDSNGAITAKKAGTATITASTVNGKTATCTVTVKDPTTITLNKDTDKLEEGTTDLLSATVTPDDIASKGVTWKSDNPYIASVDSTGTITGKNEGTATITATTIDGKTASCIVTVTPAVNRDKSLLAITMTNGQTEVFNTTMDTVDNFISWYKLRSTGVGQLDYIFNKLNARILKTEYISFDKISSFEVNDYTRTSSTNITRITLNKTTDKLKPGASDVLSATVTPTDIASKGITWSSSDKTIADVDSTGKISALKDGTAIITAATADGKIAKCTITVDSTANTDIEPLSITMTNGQTKIFNATMDKINDFIAWRNSRSTGVGDPFYTFDTTQTFDSSIIKTDYVISNEISSFDIYDN